MKRTANATEIRFKEPTVKEVIPVVIINPIIIDKIKLKINLSSFNAAKGLLLQVINLKNH